MFVSIEYFDSPMVKNFDKWNEGKKGKKLEPVQPFKTVMVNGKGFVRSKDDAGSIAALVIENKPEFALWGKGQVAGHAGYRVDFSVDLWKN